MTEYKNRYSPDTVSLPGETLLELINERGMSQKELAQRMDRPEKTINEIIKGKAIITPATAVQLEGVLGVPSHFWINREALYQEFLSRNREYEHLSQSVIWLRPFPIAQMIKYGWIEKFKNPVEQLKEVLNFFGVASIDAWNKLWLSEGPKAAFRISLAFSSENACIAAWLRHGERKIMSSEVKPFEERKLRESLPILRSLTTQKPHIFSYEIKRILGEAGVHLVFSPPIKNASISGAVRWIGNNPLIQLSGRGKHNDKFWFTLFHEIGHILLHGKKDYFIEDVDDFQSENKKELEADEFARELLIPKSELAAFIEQKDFTANAIIRFAKRIGIHSGIVVGQLQKLEFISFSYLTDLKKPVEIEMD